VNGYDFRKMIDEKATLEFINAFYDWLDEIENI